MTDTATTPDPAASAPGTEADRRSRPSTRRCGRSGDYAAVATELIYRARSASGRGLRDRAGRPGPRRRGRQRQRRHPGGAAGARSWPATSRRSCSRSAARRRGRAGLALEWRQARRRGAAVRRRRRSTPSCRGRRDVRAAPPGQPPTSSSGSCRPGGTIGLISWTPEGFIGQMFAAMKPYRAAASAGCAAAAAVGRRGRTCAAVRRPGRPTSTARGSGPRRRSSRRPRTSATTSRRSYGPTIAAYRVHRRRPDEGRRSWTRRSGLGAPLRHRGDVGAIAMEWEYLLLTCGSPRSARLRPRQ